MTQRVAILGLGTMGMGMAKNLLKADFAVAVHNRTSAKAASLGVLGARIAATPADAARDADVVISILSDDDASKQTWTGEDGALKSARPGTVLVESSTVTPAWISELELLAAERTAHLIDAPVTGSRQQAESGQLIFLVGADPGILEQVRPVLSSMSKDIVLLGPVGSGARMKLINNFLAGVQVASLAEAMAWVERSGLDREQALKILCNGAPGSPLINAVSARMTAADYHVNFRLSLMRKDLHYAGSDAATLKLDLRMAEAAEMRFADAIDAGHGGQDISAIIEPLRAQKPLGS